MVPDSEKTLYSVLRPQLKEFDLVFFRGGDVFSDAIRYVSKKFSRPSPSGYDLPADSFSHVGMIVTDKILRDDRVVHDKLYIWESTMSGPLTDGVKNIDGKSFLGVQLRDLDEVVEAYLKVPGTEIAFSPIKEEIVEELTLKTSPLIIQERFREIFDTYNGVRYDANPYSLFSAVIPCLRPMREEVETYTKTGKWLFCSELVATVYVSLDLLPRYVNPKDILPVDFLGYGVDSETPVVVEKPVYVRSN